MIQEKKIRTFVKRKGRKISDNKKSLLVNANNNNIIIDLDDRDWLEEVIESKKKIYFEIGFGSGEHLAYLAKLYPEIIFIGCEPFELGVTKLLARIDSENIKNIYIYQNDALDLLNILPNNFISKLFVLYPDPWPKTKHHKRRIINSENLKLFSDKLIKDSGLFIATDHNQYASWIIAHLINNSDFRWKIKDVDECFVPPKEWSETKYQQKSLDNKDKHYFFDFAKN